MLRPWLRRRRVILVVSGALAIIVVPFLLVAAAGANGAAFVLSAAAGGGYSSASDYDTYNYEAVAGVHAMVHQMSHSKARHDVIGVRFLNSRDRIRTHERYTYDDDDDDGQNRDRLRRSGDFVGAGGAGGGGYVGEREVRTGSMKSRRRDGGSRKGIFRRKIQDSEDVPPEEVKGYSFLHQKQPPRTPHPPLAGTGNSDDLYQAKEDEDDYGEKEAEASPREQLLTHDQNDEDDLEGDGDKDTDADIDPKGEVDEENDDDDDYREEGEDAYEYWSRNREFRPGDFDDAPPNWERPRLHFEDLPAKTGVLPPPPGVAASPSPTTTTTGSKAGKMAGRAPVNDRGTSVLRARTLQNSLYVNSETGGGLSGPSEGESEGTGVNKGGVREGRGKIQGAGRSNSSPSAVVAGGNSTSKPSSDHLSDKNLRFAPNCDRKMGCAAGPQTVNRNVDSIMRNEQPGTILKDRRASSAVDVRERGGGSRRARWREGAAGSAVDAAVRTAAGRPRPGAPGEAGRGNPPKYRRKTAGAPADRRRHRPEPPGETALGPGLLDQPATQLQMPELPPQQGEVVSRAGFTVVRDKIYWSETVEGYVSPGVTSEGEKAFRKKVAKLQVREMHAPQWNRCGRPKNQYVVLEDGTALCARYRAPHTKMLQGEVLSFHLAHLLGIDSVPVSVLVEVNSSAPRWRLVEPAAAGWEDGQLVVFTQWVQGLDQVWSQSKMPPIILSAYQKGAPVDRNHPALLTMSPAELAELLQWSDMVVFDYIIGHYDRVASMQDGAEREQKASIMSESIRNLRRVPSTGRLWFVDNESGLVDGYELMTFGRSNGPRFVRFHQQMLATLCLFRRQLVERLRRLAQEPNPHDALVAHARSREPLYEHLPGASKANYFRQFFHSRLKEVLSWLEHCRAS